MYLGTPPLAVPTLEALVAAGYEIPLVVTGADARRSRRGDPEPSAVAQAASAHGITVSHDVVDVVGVDVDLGIVVAYGKIIPTSVLDVLPMLNLHFSLLPRWRGAAPVERALLAGDAHSGVCVMDVAEALDEGDIYARAEVAIGADATLQSLRDELVALGTDLLLTGLRDGFGPPEPQQGDAVYAAKITQEDRRLDFTQSAEMVRRVVSLGDAWTTFRGRRFKIWAVRILEGPASEPGRLSPPSDGVGPRVATADRWVELVEVQLEGKAKSAATDWARGARLEPGDRLGS